jgi:hypothetical protein
MNLSTSIVELQAVTVACIKRYAAFVQQNPDQDDEEELSTPTAMYGEVSRTLLAVVKHCVRAKNIDRNLHIIYALVYNQTDFKRVVAVTSYQRYSESESSCSPSSKIGIFIATAKDTISFSIRNPLRTSSNQV